LLYKAYSGIVWHPIQSKGTRYLARVSLPPFLHGHHNEARLRQ